MKQFFVFILMTCSCTALKAQNDSLKAESIQNAYQVSRQILKMKTRLSEPGYVIKPIDRYNFKVLTSTLIWYADLQDEDSQNNTNRLTEKLSAGYSALGDHYSVLAAKLYELERILSEDILGVQQTIAQLSSEQEKALRVELKAYWKEIGEKMKQVNELDDSTKSLNLLMDHEAVALKKIANIDFRLRDTTISDELKKFDSSTKADLVRQVEDFRKEMLKKKTVISGLQKKTDDLVRKVEKLKESLTINFKSGNISNVLASALSEVSDINNYINIEKLDNRQLDQLNREKEVIQSLKEVVYEAGSAPLVKFGLPSEAEMIDAVAIYLAKRVKQESVMWFFETIKKDARRYDLIQTFFPNTITLLQSNEVYEIPNLGAQWRYALSKDFVKMPRNVLTSSWFNTLSTKLKLEGGAVDLKKLLISAFDVADLLSQQYNYQQIVKNMYLKNLETDTSSRLRFNASTIFSVLYAINQECYLPDSTKKFRLLRYEDFRNISREELEIMISLMDMKYSRAFKSLWGVKGDSTTFLDKGNVEAFRRWAGNIESGIGQFNKVSADFTKTQDAIGNGKKVEAAYSAFNVWDHLNGLMALVSDIPTPQNENIKILLKNSERIKDRLQNAFEIYNQLSLKNYAGAVNSTITMVEHFLYPPNDSIFVDRKDVAAYMEAKKIVVSKGFADKYFDDTLGTNTFKLQQNTVLTSVLFERDRQAIKLVRRLSGFLNDVMLSGEDSKKLSKVVESYAVPAGSYKRKRNSWNSIDLNAYVGAFYGKEWLGDVDEGGGMVYGLTAPIGFSFNKTFGRRLKARNPLTEDLIRNQDKIKISRNTIRRRGNSTFTLDLSVVDLAAVVSYRISNTEEKGLPQDVKWAQLFSPGLKLAYGIPGTPLVGSFGYQYTPQLRKFDAVDPKLFSAHRLYFGLLFDLPLMHIWQSGGK